LIKAEPKKEYLQLLATKLNRNNGLIKYAKIIEELPHGQVSHTQLIDIHLTEKEKEKEDKRVKDQAVN